MATYLSIKTIEAGSHSVRVAAITARAVFDQDAVEQCKKELEELDPSEPIVLDMEHLEHVSSTFIVVLLNLHRASRQKGGRLSICNVTPPLMDLMRILKLDKLFSITKSTEEAIEAVTNGIRH